MPIFKSIAHAVKHARTSTPAYPSIANSRPITMVVSIAALLATTPAPAGAQETANPDNAGDTQQVRQLPPVVVTATRTQTSLEEVGSSMTVITSEDLADRQTMVVSDILREVPGLAINRTGVPGNLTQVRIRGAEGNHTLVLIDGIEVNDISGGSEFDFAHMLASDIERIEVLRGAQSTLYGSDAIGGVINIITKQGKGDFRVGGSLEGGSRMTGQANLNLGGSTEKFRYYLSATGFHTDGFSSAAGRHGNDEKDGYENATVFGKLGVSPSEFVDLDVVVRHTWYEGEYDGYDPTGVVPMDADNEGRGEQLFARGQAKIKLFDGKWEHILGTAFSDHENRDYTDGVRQSVFGSDKTKFDYQTNYYLDTPDFADAAHTFTFGFEHEIDRIDATSAFTDLQKRLDTQSYFAQYQLSLWDRLFLTAGGRFDDNEIFENAETMRFTAAYLHKETSTKIHGSYGTGFKAPTMFELYGYANNYRGNPDLEPEESVGFDIGLEQSLFDDRVTIGATYFHNDIENLIQGAGQTSINLPGKSRIRGVEVALGVEVIEGLDVTGSYTFTHGEDSAGDELIRRAPHVASLNVNYRFLEDRANLNLGVIYNGDQKDWIFTFPRQTTTLDEYVTVNLAGSYRLTDNFEIFGRVENLLDETYEEVWGFGATGRAGYLGVRANF